MNCTQCGEALFSALERTRGVCASCFLSYKPERKAEAIGQSSGPRPQASQSADSGGQPPEMEGSGQSGEATA
jgi:hypothetical protein